MIAVPAIPILATLLACVALAPATAFADAVPSAWDVTIAMRVSAEDDKSIEVHVALPPDDAQQSVSNVVVKSRGLTSEIVRGAEPEVIFRGRAEGSRRVSVNFRVERTPGKLALPVIHPAIDPPRDVLDALRPAPLYPSRSILVREFLETHVAPKLQEPDFGMVQAIYQTIREKLPYDRDGKSLPLDVLRRGHGLRIGRERVFTACLRSAGIPARFVEGIDLTSSTRRKRRFWNEVWADGTWYRVSLSGGWSGRFPDDYVAMVADGRRIVRARGDEEVEYIIIAQPAPARTPVATPGPSPGRARNS